ncbi:hypothetical protein AB7942_01910 [Neobacillus sp. BF23-41]
MMSSNASVTNFIPLLDVGKESARWNRVYKVLTEPKPDIVSTP